MAQVKSIREIVEESLNQSMLEAFQKEMLKGAGWIGVRLEMPRRGRYQVWDGFQLVADRIKHRKEALAIIKLLGETNGTS
jgi:hypothetical protein